MSTKHTHDLTRPEWFLFGNQAILQNKGKRPAILTTTPLGGLKTCGESGLLEDLTPDHPVAMLILAAPKLLEAYEHFALTVVAGEIQNGNIRGNCADVLTEHVERAREIIAKAKGESNA
jgi:hypothetical protein